MYMNSQFDEEFEALVVKFAELLTGETSEDVIQKVKYWTLYNHIHKTMPALTSHWNQEHPESKTDVRTLFEEIRELNSKHRASSSND